MSSGRRHGRHTGQHFLVGMALTTLVLPAGAASVRSVEPASAVLTYVAQLSGLNEDPPNDSTATGTARVELDLTARTLRVQFSYEGLLGDLTAAHIHACTGVPFAGNAGVATQVPTFTDTPVGTTSGAYDMTFDTSASATFNPAYVTASGSVAAAEAALAACIAADRAYLNLHTNLYPAGEIRGFLQIDTDADGIPDDEDLDDDGDGQSDEHEIACGSDPRDPASMSPDLDGDGIPDCVDPSPGTTSTTSTATTSTATTGTGVPAATNAVPGSTSTVAVDAGGTLPSTGAGSSDATTWGLLLLTVGGLLLLVARRPSVGGRRSP